MPWLAFFLRGVSRQARDAEVHTVRLAEHLFSVPVINAARAESLLGVTRPTAHATVDVLIERRDLIETTGKERGRIYESPRIFGAVYGTIEPGPRL